MKIYQKSADRELWIDEVANTEEACKGMTDREHKKRRELKTHMYKERGWDESELKDAQV